MRKQTNLLLTPLLLALLLPILKHGQKKVAITIDDVPNSIKYQNDDFKPILLSKINSLNIPITIFVTVGLLYKNDSIAKNIELLNNWIKRSYTIIGYHAHSQSKNSVIGKDSFKWDVENGELILKKLFNYYNKPIKYFRFPYNDIGKDSTQHIEIAKYILSKNYVIAPFTVENEDFIFMNTT